MFKLLSKPERMINYRPNTFRLPYGYIGIWDSIGFCEVEIHIPHGYWHPSVIITSSQAKESRATSITNMFEDLATQIARAHFPSIGIRPQDVIWFEHYPEDWGRYYWGTKMVTLQWDKKKQYYHSPMWSQVPTGLSYSIDLVPKSLYIKLIEDGIKVLFPHQISVKHTDNRV